MGDINKHIWVCDCYKDAVEDRRYVEAFILAKGNNRPYVKLPDIPVEEE